MEVVDLMGLLEILIMLLTALVGLSFLILSSLFWLHYKLSVKKYLKIINATCSISFLGMAMFIVIVWIGG